MNKYYLLDEELYNKCIQQPYQPNPEFFIDLRPKQSKRCQALLNFFEEKGVELNVVGITTHIIPEFKVNINFIQYIIYCILPQGRKPVLFESFLEYLKRLGAPIELLHPKIVKYLQYNKNGKQKKTKSDSK